MFVTPSQPASTLSDFSDHERSLIQAIEKPWTCEAGEIPLRLATRPKAKQRLDLEVLNALPWKHLVSFAIEMLIEPRAGQYRPIQPGGRLTALDLASNVNIKKALSAPGKSASLDVLSRLGIEPSRTTVAATTVSLCVW